MALLAGKGVLCTFCCTFGIGHIVSYHCLWFGRR